MIMQPIEHDFTACIVTKAGMVWYHDGIFTGRSLVYQSGVNSSLPWESALTAMIAIYIRNYSKNSDMPYAVLAH